MTLLSIISLVFGSIGVILTIKQSIWCWLFALIGTVTSMIDFFEARLFGDMALQVFYFIAGVYGWVFWKQQQQQVFVVTHTPPKKNRDFGFVNCSSICFYIFLFYAILEVMLF